jgi:phenylpropionate dioxygenase-like ring-hydroxylating dioxygenase large terminal subunit
MLSDSDNALLTQTGPGTPMGDVMRRYWLPTLLSTELSEPDSPPIRVKLLGEQLVAFRNTSGRVGMLEEFCPHRGVSLWLGRNEENGLRCVFHGWKYDVDGNCVDQMSERKQFREKVHLVSYPTVELAGVVWTYMGPRELQPPPPNFAWTQVDEDHRHATKVVQGCNWLQAFEGGIDTAHAPILHRALKANSTRGLDPNSANVRGGAPDLEVDVTDYGYRYFGLFDLGDKGTFVRAYQYIMPFTQARPAEQGILGNHGHYWVPMDDEECMVWNWVFSVSRELTEEDRLEEGRGNGPSHVDQTTFRSYANARNGWLIDRQVQKEETFTGIDGINTQDRATQESMGPLVNRKREHLGPADKAIIEARKLLLEAIKTVRDGGLPLGSGDSYYLAQAAQGTVPKGEDWREVMVPQTEAAWVG